MTKLNQLLASKEPAMTTKEVNQYYSLLFGFKTTAPFKAIREGKQPNNNVAVKMEKHFGLSIEELYKPVK